MIKLHSILHVIDYEIAMLEHDLNISHTWIEGKEINAKIEALKRLRMVVSKTFREADGTNNNLIY